MKRTLAVAAVLAALAQPMQARAQSAQGAQQLDEALARAFEANDPAAVAALYAPDAVQYPPAVMEQRGQAAIRQGFSDMTARYRITDFAMADTHYETAGDVSTGWGRFVASAVPRAGGAAERWEGRFSTVARRIRGKWLIVSKHASMPLPAPPGMPRPVSNPAR